MIHGLHEKRMNNLYKYKFDKFKLELFISIYKIKIIIVLIFITMNLSKRSGDKELFSGERSSKENIFINILYQCK